MSLANKYILVLAGFFCSIFLMHVIFYSNYNARSVVTFLFLQVASIVAGVWLFQAFRKGKKDHLFWLLLLLATLSFYVSEGLALPSLLFAHKEMYFSHHLFPFFIFPYFLYFLAFASKIVKKNRLIFVLQFLFDAVFIIIVSFYLISSWILDTIKQPTLQMNATMISLYFISLSMALYGSFSVYRYSKELPLLSRKLLVVGFAAPLLFDYFYFYEYLQNIIIGPEIGVIIHVFSVLCIGIVGSMFTEGGYVSEHTSTDELPDNKIDYVRLYLPYVSIFIVFDLVYQDISNEKNLLPGLGLAIILLMIRQFLLWQDNKKLLQTYYRLNEKLEEKVDEGIHVLAKQEQQYRSLFEDHPDAVFSLDVSGNFQMANKSCMMLLGHNQKQLQGQSFLNFIIEDDQYITRDHMRQAKKGLLQTFEARAIRSENLYSFLHITLIPTVVGDRTIGMYGIAKDTTELKQNQRQIEHMAFHDALTGLANRRRFAECLDDSLITANKRETMAAVLFIDLDRFKKINDRLGHDIGDLLLVEVGKRLQTSLRSKDVVARQGGDEFTVLLTDVFSKKTVVHVAERILDALNEPFHIRDHELKITPSMGIALYPSHGTNVTKLMKHADIAMYRSKSSGKNKFMFYSSEMSDVEDERHFLEGELNKALQEHALILHYQPQVDVKSNQIIGFEALLRWNHPKFGMVSPARFIPLAEETGLIVPIGEWVLQTACKQAKLWHEHGYKLKVGVNLSPMQFKQPNLVQLVAKTLQETKLPPEYLDLEITEGVAMNKEEQVIRKLQSFHEIGVKISIDDFGTGYSSLSYLTKYPIHTLKIAREFIREIENNPQEAAIVSTIITMAKNLRLTVIAEGVENDSQWSFLDKEKCDQIQGFIVSKPIASDYVWKLLEARNGNLSISGKAFA
ncbi:DUF4084 domain-containing protein [Ectobacillus sp. sgz5001026]|uniref:DUF4084 domain-containing protein n=1 Tax=Ectobacillus sp. sgz5001026 TaxID=3242473 RepID=UPI0036D3D0D1